MSAKSLKIRIPEHLWPQDRQVLRLVANGEPTKSIAAKMGLSHKTVEWYRHRISLTTGLNNVAQLTKLALRLGMTEIDV